MKRSQPHTSQPDLFPETPAAANPPAASAAPSAEAAAEPGALAPASVIPPPTGIRYQGPQSLAGQSVWVIDAHSLIFQVFHVMQDMSGPAGQPVGAIFGFTRDILYLLDEKRPDYLLAAFDEHAPTFRHALAETYKANREEMPVDLQPQIPLIRELLGHLGVPALGVAGYEADDILATVAREVDRRGGQCVLVTGDKDCRQLITPKVRLYNIRKNLLMDSAALLDEWGIRPDQVVDFQALRGDPTDNVPGVRGIGEKTARKLLEQFDTLEGIYENLEDIKAKGTRTKLEAGREDAFTSRELVRLTDAAPVAVDLAAADGARQNVPAALALFKALGFRGFGERLRERTGLSAARGEAGPGAAAWGNAPEAIAPATTLASPEWKASYRRLTTLEDVRELAARLAAAEAFSFDTETTHTSPRWADLVGLSFCLADGDAVYAPVAGPPGDPVLPLAETLEILRGPLEDPQIAKVGQNLKYDVIVLRGHGVNVAGVRFDTMLADYLLEAGRRNHNLDDLARRYLGHTTQKIKELIGSGKRQKRMDEVPVDDVTAYAAEDADVPWRLRPLLAEQLSAAGLAGLFDELEVPLIAVLAELEFNGVKIDVPRLKELSDEYGLRLAGLEQEIYEAAGCEFNIASPKQLAKVLFDDLGLPQQKKTKTGASTDAEVLSALARLHPAPAKMLEHRQYAKLKGTYIDALPQLVCPKTGRVHSSLNQVVAATGRLSSNDPNLQNIPIRTAEGREIRSAFIPGEKGWLLLAADYSQIELRMLAHFSGDEAMQAAFAQGEDIHTRVASEVFSAPADAVTREMRRRAKAVNFGVIYGQSPFGLARALDISKEDAANFIEAYFARYPGVEQFMEELLETCRKRGFVSTILGRRRAIEGVRDAAGRNHNRRQRNLAERTAINTVIQGSAADLIKQAMLDMHARLKASNLPTRMLLQIHDELLFEVEASAAGELENLVVEVMADAFNEKAPLSVPLKVDVKTGIDWAEC